MKKKNLIILLSTLVLFLLGIFAIFNSESYINNNLKIVTMLGQNINGTIFNHDYKLKNNKLYIKISSDNANIDLYSNFEFLLDDEYPIAKLKLLDKNGYVLKETYFNKNDIIIDKSEIYFFQNIDITKSEAKNITAFYFSCIRALLKE